MHRNDRSHGVWVVTAGLLLGLGLPGVAGARGPSADETVTAVKGSKLFRRALQRDQLKAAGFEKIELSPGVNLDFQGWVRDTALDARPEFKPLLDPKLPAGLLRRAPVYDEAIYELEDRLVVDRKLTLELAPGACNKPDKPAAVAELCFTKNPGNQANKGVDQELAKIRAKLAKADGATIVHGTVTAEQARQMDDAQLLDLLLNTGERTIHQVSVVPRGAVKIGPVGSLHKFGTRLQPAALESGLMQQHPEVLDPKGGLDPKGSLGPKGGLGPIAPIGGANNFAREYFLTGFTYGREIDDTWEYQIAPATWLTDRYFVRVQYHLGLGFGLRAPFAVDLKSSSTGADGRSVELAVEPIDVDTAGRPAYQAVGLPAGKTFDGKEFVLEFKASCSLYVSIPGPNIDKKCPTLDLDYSRDVNPVLGTDRSNIGEWWLDGAVTGLKVSAAVASASLDVGLAADVTNGKIGVRATALNGAALSGVGNGNLSFSNKSPRTFSVTRTPGQTGARLRLDRPTYGFDIAITPKLRAKVKVDVSILEKTWILGPWALGFLSISKSFELGHHAGTVANHDYDVFRLNTPMNEMSPDVAPVNPQPTMKKPTKQLQPSSMFPSK